MTPSTQNSNCIINTTTQNNSSIEDAQEAAALVAGPSCRPAATMMQAKQCHTYKGLVLVAFGVAFLVMQNFRFLLDLSLTRTPSSTQERYSELPINMGDLDRNGTTTTGSNPSILSDNNRSETSGNLSTMHPAPLRPQQPPDSTRIIYPPSHSSFCLLTKDDTDVLPEWIAYHYHTMNMRRIIVALDPDSETTPQEILDQWQSTLRLNYALWTDPDYMPKDFLEGDFSKVPNYIKGKRSRQDSYWHQGQNISQEQIRQDLQKINHHRYRQRVFLAECYRRLKQEGQHWTVHVDTDEFVTINPLLRPVVTSLEQQTAVGAKSELMRITNIELPQAATAGSLLKLWEDLYEHHQNLVGSTTCGLMPSLKFGFRESDNMRPPHETILFNTTNFETLRWMYHGEHAPRPKSIVNVAFIPINHKALQEGRVFDPHIPLFRADKQHDCHRKDIAPFNVTKYEALQLQDEKAALTVLSYPLYVNHYLGSLERFLSRSDARRSENIYRERAKGGNGFHADEWIQSWLDNFVQDQGVKRMHLVLGQVS